MDRKNVTFEQAEGAEALPEPLALGELSKELRSYIWLHVHTSLRYSRKYSDGMFDVPRGHHLGDPWLFILKLYHIQRLFEPIDEFSSDWNDHANAIKKLVYEGDYQTVIGFMQWILRTGKLPKSFFESIQNSFLQAKAAYRLEADPATFYPAATREEGEAIVSAARLVRAQGFVGAAEHLQNAAAEINDENFADAVRESIHAVESVAKRIDENSNTTLGPALKRLKEACNIHPALQEAFSKLYGYTSDADGIRHAIIEDPKTVTIHEATFMLGACASFITYLIGRAGEAGILDDQRASTLGQ